MPKYIKSHSNYRISQRHQTVDGGSIFERDITTIGGVSPLAATQSTIYSNGNFIMTINNTSEPPRHILNKSWLQNDISGETWSAEVLENQTSDINGSVESMMVLKNDFTDLRSFACYGSLYMLIQNAIGDILERFPYELFTTNGGVELVHHKLSTYLEGTSFDWDSNVTEYTKDFASEVSFYDIESIGNPSKYYTEGASSLYEISNPGGIDIHSTTINSNDSSLKYFANGGYKNYVYIDERYENTYDENGLTFEWESFINPKISFDCPEPDELVSKISIKVSNGHSFYIYAFRDEDLEIKYYTDIDNLFVHLRPSPAMSFYDNFIESLDPFQKALMGYFSGIKNTAKFEVYTEYNHTTTKQTKVFKLPAAPGDYNLIGESFLMADYIQDLAKIGLAYDEKYTDNLYRTVTHESLKNFDWTKDFNGNDNDYNNDYIANGDKFKSVIRIMGYVFDKEKNYIDCIGNTNTVTYNNRNNIPDYFLSDALALDGWDIKTIPTFDLTEYDKTDGSIVEQEDWSEINQQHNFFKRVFSENTIDIIQPYQLNEGGFIITCEDGCPTLQSIGITNKSYYVDDGKVKNVITNYTSQQEYTIPDINNEFLKRLKINSKFLLRSKGTIAGMEAMLGLFGLKGYRWFHSIDNQRVGFKFSDKFSINLENKYPFDYKIQEYSAFAAPIKETWNVAKKMYTIDFYNTCKTIPYDTSDYMDGVYVPYQGLPVAYRDLSDTYIAYSGGTSWETTDENDENICLDERGEKVHARRLYPYFDKDSIHDGGMYYQMDGGWQMHWPYSFDVDDEIIQNYEGSIAKQTLRNVRQVHTVEDLINLPTDSLNEGDIFYVTNIKQNYAIINGILYQLKPEIDEDGNVFYYFIVQVKNGVINIGNDLYEEFITVSDRLNNEGVTYYIPSLHEGEQIKIYYTNKRSKPFEILGYTGTNFYRYENVNGVMERNPCNEEDFGAFLLKENQQKPQTMSLFFDGSYELNYTSYTPYFKLNNVNNSEEFGEDGWKQLAKTDNDYFVANSATDYLLGNNPHSAVRSYDCGYEYMSRFSKLFKYAFDNDLFDFSCFEKQDDVYAEVENIGFSGLTEQYGIIKDYSAFIHPDNKIHDYIDKILSDGNIEAYNMNDKSHIKTFYPYVQTLEDADGVSAQIMNTKIIVLSFYLKSRDFYSKQCQEEVKHIQDKILPYVEQMIPSTSILKVKFYVYPFDWIFDEDTSTPEIDCGTYHSYHYWTEDGIWINGPEDCDMLNSGQ